MDVEEMLAQQVARVRELYCDARRRFDVSFGRLPSFGTNNEIPAWDGGEDSAGVMHKPVWPKIVAFCRENELDPARLVRAVFDSVQGMQPPMPTMLYSKAALALYAKHVAAEPLLLEQQLAYCSSQAATHYSWFMDSSDDTTPEHAIIRVVLCTPPMLTPLFRYCYAMKAGMTQLATKFADLAFNEYVWSHKAYNDIWSEWIPAELREKADRLLNGVT